MELIHEEDYPGNDGKKIYRIRIFEEQQKMTTSISRVIINDKGEEEVFPMSEYSDKLLTPLSDLVEKAKRTILLIWMNI